MPRIFDNIELELLPAGKIVGIEVIDNIINGHFSFQAEGMLKKI